MANVTTKQQDGDCVTVACCPRTAASGTVITTGHVFLDKSTYVIRYASNEGKIKIGAYINPIMIYIFFQFWDFVTDVNIEK